MWTEGGTGHGADVVMLEEVVRDPGRVWVGVVVGANGVSMATKKLWDGFGVRALVNTLLLHFLDLGQDFER